MGFGPLPEGDVLNALLAVKGLPLDRDFTDALDRDEVPAALRATEASLRETIVLLRRDAGFAHVELLPYTLPIVVLSKFFHEFPTPRDRSRLLLRRWLWRGALGARLTGATVGMRQHLACIRKGDEEGSVCFEETLALAIRRFDRDEQGSRIHQEDFAQVLNMRPRDKYRGHNYATIANIVRVVCGEPDYEELMRRLVFVVLSGNAGAHLKNWSLVYPDGRRGRLSPAYDLVSTLAYGPGLDQRPALRLSGEKDFSSITRAHFEKLAERINASPERTGDLVSETASRAREAWASLRAALPIAPGARDALEKHLRICEI